MGRHHRPRRHQAGHVLHASRRQAGGGVMNHVAHNTAMRSAQRQHDNASPDDCDDLAEQIHSEYLTDADKCAEADANWSGTLDGSQYSDIETALADLHSVDPSDLLGSAGLARVYRLDRQRVLWGKDGSV